MTVDDLLWDNVDLLRHVVGILKQETCYGLRQVGSIERTEGSVIVKIATQNLSHLDIAVDGWNSPSKALTPEASEYTVEAILPPNGKGETLEICGFDKEGDLVAGDACLCPMLYGLRTRPEANVGHGIGMFADERGHPMMV